jgi:glycosyltransferase involved in cell wall biosynthesis
MRPGSPSASGCRGPFYIGRGSPETKRRTDPHPDSALLNFREAERLSLGPQPTGAHVTDRPTLLCFSHLRWHFVYQRPQHLLGRAARTHRVVFLEEPVYTDDDAPHLSASKTREGVLLHVPMIPHRMRPMQRDVLRGFVDQLTAGLTDIITWYYDPRALAFSRHLPARLCVYDCMDELANFKGAPDDLRIFEQELMSRADIVFTGGRSLFYAKRSRHPRVHLFPSSIDREHFAKARTGKEQPVDQSAIPRPRIGFFGVIDERMDLQLLSTMADLRSDWHFVMIGPVVKIDPASLPQARNIHWLGPRAYDELPQYLSGWDAAFMPFAINDATRFISPTKTPEFLAAGVPVASTPIRDVVDTFGPGDIVAFGSSAQSMVLACQTAMNSRGKAQWQSSVDKILSCSSWDTTWREMLNLMAPRSIGSRVAASPGGGKYQGGSIPQGEANA